jgi:hypothetical protein
MTARTFTFTVTSASGPTWAAAATLNQWVPVGLAGTDTRLYVDGVTDAMSRAFPEFGLAAYGATAGGKSKPSVWAYCGLAMDAATATLWSVANGGHNDYWGNEAYSLALNVAQPTWKRHINPTIYTYNNEGDSGDVTDEVGTGDDAYIAPDNYPVSRHSYAQHVYDSGRSRVFMLAGAATSVSGNTYTRNVDAFNTATRTYDAPGTWTRFPTSIYPQRINPDANGVEVNGDVYFLTDISGGNLVRWNRSDASWTAVRTFATAPSGNSGWCYDSLRNRIFQMPSRYWTGSESAILGAGYYDLNNTGAFTGVALSGVSSSEFLNRYTSTVYEPSIDRYLTLKWADGNPPTQMYVTHPTTFAVTIHPAAVPNDPLAGSGVWTRFRYSSLLGGVVWACGPRQHVYFMRTH